MEVFQRPQRAKDFSATGEGNQRLSGPSRISTVRLQEDFRELIALGRALPEEQRKQRAQLLQLCLDLCRSPDGASMAFWSATLCCPTEPEEANGLAISLMRRTYSEAAAVVVIGAWLTSQIFDNSHPDKVIFHTMLSAWTRRLWTFQEGMLAQQLWVRFADGLVYFNEVKRQIRQSLECRFLPTNTTLSRTAYISRDLQKRVARDARYCTE